MYMKNSLITILLLGLACNAYAVDAQELARRLEGALGFEDVESQYRLLDHKLILFTVDVNKKRAKPPRTMHGITSRIYFVHGPKPPYDRAMPKPYVALSKWCSVFLLSILQSVRINNGLGFRQRHQTGSG